MILYVIRHGETKINARNLINGINQIGINIKGKKQAKKAAEELKNVDIDVIFCSPLKRTKQTCKIVNTKKVKVIIDKRIIERDSGNIQFTKADKVDFKLWFDTKKELIYEDTEGFKSILDRVKELIQEVKAEYSNSTVLFVTHGDVCRAIYSYLNNITTIDEICDFKQRNCEIKKYTI